MWKKAAQLIRKSQRPVITTHEHPDGDAIGSEVALAELFRALGKSPTILNSDPAPNPYSFLCRKQEPLIFDPDKHHRRLQQADLAVLLDANYWDRAGHTGQALARLEVPSLCIDHHEWQQDFTTVQIGVQSASSTCELVYELAEYLKVKQTQRFREAIYAGLLFDTGNFRFSNTNPNTHEIAGELIRDGVSVQQMYERVFETFSWSRMRLFHLALNTLRSECGGRLAWFTVSQEMLDESGAKPDEVEGFVDWVRTIRDTKLILFFRDYQDGQVKGSFRSKTDKINVEQLSRKFGGGGHKRAAGVTMKGPLENAARKVVREAKKIVKSVSD